MVPRGGIRRSVKDLADITEDAPPSLSLSRAASASPSGRGGHIRGPAGTGAGERAGGFVAPRSVPLTLKLRQQATPRLKRPSLVASASPRCPRCEDFRERMEASGVARRDDDGQTM
jgi:hypothetical protein